MILTDTQEKIARYNKHGMHYNIVADFIYSKRKSLHELFDTEYLPYIVAALISFDMERMIGKGAENKYDIKAGGFAAILHKKLLCIKSMINHLNGKSIMDIDLKNEKSNIETAYRELSAGGQGGLNQNGGDFQVGATKILHFLNPDLFLIIDSNAAKSFKAYHSIDYRDTTQPGYTAEKYIECMSCAKADIVSFGRKAFSKLEQGTPIARIYDKLTFVSGYDP